MSSFSKYKGFLTCQKGVPCLRSVPDQLWEINVSSIDGFQINSFTNIYLCAEYRSSQGNLLPPVLPVVPSLHLLAEACLPLALGEAGHPGFSPLCQALLAGRVESWLSVGRAGTGHDWHPTPREILLDVEKISLLRKLQARTLLDATPTIGKINPFSKFAINFETIMQFWY